MPGIMKIPKKLIHILKKPSRFLENKYDEFKCGISEASLDKSISLFREYGYKYNGIGTFDLKTIDLNPVYLKSIDLRQLI